MQQQISPLTTEIKLIRNTKACCSTCFSVTPADVVEKNGKVFMLKECCSKEEVLIENDVEYYKKYSAVMNYGRTFVEMAKNNLVARYRREFNRQSPCILVTVTLKCNLDCPICVNTKFPSQVNHQTDVKLPLESIKKTLAQHKGKIVTLWGGEPTLRQDLPEIIRAVKESGNSCTLCTNGLRLLDLEYCRTLKKAGLDYVDLQFDGFRDDIYVKFRGIPLLEKKMKILKNLKEVGMRTSLIAVIGKGVNEDQIPLLVKFASMNPGFLNDVSLIELYTGNLGDEERLTHSDILKTLENTLGIPTELYLQTRKLYFNVGSLIYKIFGKHFVSKAENFNYLTTIYLEKNENGFKPYFNIEWLNKTNEILEASLNKGRIGCILNLIKNAPQFLNKNFINAAGHVVANGFDVFKAGIAIFSPNITKITLCGVRSPLNEDVNHKGYITEMVNTPVITNAALED